jgi:hypothetical protein
VPLALWGAGCDLERPEVRAVGPDVHVVDMFPGDGCGSGVREGCAVPTNATITLRVDRFLDPSTVNRQAITVYTGDPATGSPFTYQVVYDPVERVVEFRLGESPLYLPHTLYQFELEVPKAAGDYGIRAFDGAPLAPGDVPLRGSFLTSDEPTVVAPPESAPTCDVIVSDVFRKLGQCAGSECHRRGDNQALGSGEDLGDAPHQLYLDSPGNFALSAIGRVARQTELGDVSGGVPAARSPRFGVGMALVTPRSPGASYLLYKALLAPENYEACSDETDSELCQLPGPCQSSHAALPLREGQCLEPPEEELDRLREWFVRGSPMPRANSRGERGSVRLQGLRALSAFIAAGASCSP